MTPQQLALLALGRALQRENYAFVTVTPETHRRFNARAEQQQVDALSLRDIFGWNRPFRPEVLPESLLSLLYAADGVEQAGQQLRSRVRFSTLQGGLFVHSAYPTHETDAVFFGPDTYRFCSLLQRWAPRAVRAADIGCGSGAGGLSIAANVEELVLADISSRALDLCEVNAALAGASPNIVRSDVLHAVPGQFDLIVANPPYMRDDAGRLYRDGGGDYGEQLSVRIVQEAWLRLAPGGTLIVYTGSAIVDGRDSFAQAVLPQLDGQPLTVSYEELDPDVFGEELERPGYGRVERIAAVGLKLCRTSGVAIEFRSS
jgi:release factor glutamine methyltransferase